MIERWKGATRHFQHVSPDAIAGAGDSRVTGSLIDQVAPGSVLSLRLLRPGPAWPGHAKLRHLHQLSLGHGESDSESESAGRDRAGWLGCVLLIS